MTSKSSLWVSFMENNKRRVGVIGIATLIFVIMFPLLFMLSITAIEKGVAGADLDPITLEEIRRSVQMSCRMYLGCSAVKNVFITIFAGICGFEGFAYLFDKTKVDFYMSMPEKKNRQLIISWANGIIMFVVTYLIGMLLSYAVLCVNGYGDYYSIGQAVYAFFINLIFYIGVYQMAIIAVLLTGNFFIGIVLFGTISVYEVLGRCLICAFGEIFFDYFTEISTMFVPKLSPFGLLYGIMTGKNQGLNTGLYTVGLILLDVAFAALIYFLFMKRSMESAGKSLAFPVTASIIKFLVVIPCSLGVGIAIISSYGFEKKLNGTNMIIVAICMLIAVAILSGIVQAILELDVKAAINKPVHIIICAAAVFVIFGVYRYDLIGYDNYVPDSSSVSSAVFIPSGYQDIYGYLDEDGTDMSQNDYCFKYMYLNDVNDVSELMRLSIDAYEQTSKNYYEDDTLSEEYKTAIILYRMKSGRKVIRRVYVPVRQADAQDKLEKIMGSERFITGYYPIYKLDVESALAELSPLEKINNFSNGVYSKKLTDEEISGFVKAYKEDYENYSYKAVYEEMPVGYVRFGFMANSAAEYGGYRYQNTMSLIVYPCMKNSMEYLKKCDVKLDGFYSADDVLSMSITNYHYDERNAEEEDSNGVYEYDESMVEKYTRNMNCDKDDIEKYMPMIYPTEDYYQRWDGGKHTDSDYEICITFEPDSAIGKQYGSYGAYFGFVRDEVPAEVIDNLKL